MNTLLHLEEDQLDNEELDLLTMFGIVYKIVVDAPLLEADRNKKNMTYLYKPDVIESFEEREKRFKEKKKELK